MGFIHRLQPIPPGLKPRCVAVTWRRSRRPCQLQLGVMGFSWSQLAPRLASWTSSHGLRTFEIRNESKCEISMDSARTRVFWQCVLHLLFVSFFFKIILKRLVSKNAFFGISVRNSGRSWVLPQGFSGIFPWQHHAAFGLEAADCLRSTLCDEADVVIALPCGENLVVNGCNMFWH